MAVTTKKQFPNAVGTNGQSATVFTPVGIQLNNQDDLDVYVTLSGGTRVLQLRQATGSTAQSTHPQVNNTDGLYFPAVSAGTTLYNYQLSTDNNTITFNSALPQGAVVFCERRTRDADSSYTTFASGSTIRATDLNNSSTESNFTAQDGRNKALTIEGVLFNGNQPSTNFITSSHIVDGSIVNADINASADIAGTKLADDSVTLAKLGGGALPTDITVASANIVNGTIVEDDIANSAVTSNKIADNAVTTTEILNGAVTRAKLEADAIDGTKLADNAVNSEHYTDGSIDRVHLEADIIDSTKLADNAVNSEHYVDGSIDRVHLEADIIDSTKLADNAVGSEHIQTNAVTDSEIATGTLDNRYFTETELTNGALDGRYFTETESDARYFNVSTGDTIKDGDTFPDNDTTIATTAAINDRIIDLVDDVGGFVPIANETSFPTANPDVNNGSGTLVSIKSISSTRTPSSGTVTIANGAGTGNTVSITGCGSTVLTAGFGVIVETTSTLHTYAFHRLVPKATEVTTVAGISSNITTVANNTSNINAVAADASDIGTVAGAITNVNNVGNSIANVNTTAGSIANVNTVAGSISNVNSVASNISNVNAVNSNQSNINSAVSNASNINSAVSNASNINTVAGSISNVNTTAGSISNVNTVANNISSVNSFANVYRTGTQNPQTSLDVGDLFFNQTSNSLKVYTGSAWVDGVTATGNFAVLTGNTFTGSNNHNDNVKSIYGTGSDLEIYGIASTGTAGIINHANGDLLIKHGADKQLISRDDGSVELYYDDSKKLETTSSGVTVTGGVTSGSGGFTTTSGNVALTADNAEVQLGAGFDFKFSHSGTENVIRGDSPTVFRNAANNETLAKLTPNGSVELYHNNSKKFETTSSGVSIAGSANLGDSNKLRLGNTQDLQIYHDGSNSIIDNDTNDLIIRCDGDDVKILAQDDIVLRDNDDSTNFIHCVNGGSVDLYYNGSKKFETTSTGATVTGHLTTTGEIFAGDDIGLPDAKKITFGASSDLRILHNNTTGNSLIQNNTGDLQIKGASQHFIGSNDENMIIANQNGAVELYHNNSKKIETSSTGATVTGNLAVTGTVDGVDIAALNTTVGNITTDVVSDTSPQLGGDLDTNGHEISLDDNHKIKFGAGNDLQIYSNGARAYIDHVTTGTGSDLFLRTKTFVVANYHQNDELMIVGNQNAAVQLYYDGVQKFATTSTGFEAYGGQFRFNGVEGGAAQLLIYADEGDDANDKWRLMANTDGTFILGTLADGSWDTAIKAHGDGQVELYHNDTKTFETTSIGARATGVLQVTDAQGADSGNRIAVGTSQDIRIYHIGGNDSYIRNYTGDFYLQGNNSGTITNNIKFENADGSTELFYDSTKKFETTSTGAKVTGTTFFIENTGDVDLVLNADTDNFDESHNPTLQFRQDGNSTHLKIGVEGSAGTTYSNSGGNTPYILTTSSTNLHLGTNNTAKWFINTDGDFKPTANNSYDIGSTSNRVANIYTNDLHLSNEGHSNDVDGSWGDWTIQEGESDLFLKNNRSGKKYKFNLTEVS